MTRHTFCLAPMRFPGFLSNLSIVRAIRPRAVRQVLRTLFPKNKPTSHKGAQLLNRPRLLFGRQDDNRLSRTVDRAVLRAVEP